MVDTSKHGTYQLVYKHETQNAYLVMGDSNWMGDYYWFLTPDVNDIEYNYYANNTTKFGVGSMNMEQGDTEYARPYEFDGSTFSWINNSYVRGTIEITGPAYTNSDTVLQPEASSSSNGSTWSPEPNKDVGLAPQPQPQP